jgi:hypothetical protein
LTTESAPNRPRVGNLLWHHAWTAVLAANLVLPMSFARDMTDDRGAIGMALAIGLLWLLGDLAGVRRPHLRPVLLSGGILVALAQLVPIFHIIAGLICVRIADRIFPGPPVDPALADVRLVSATLSPAGAFLATFLTGGLMFLASFVAGLIVHAMFLRPQSARSDEL